LATSGDETTRSRAASLNGRMGIPPEDRSPL
jgi:hypothetical protein